MKQSFYVYNNGDLKRKDNTLQFTNHDGKKRDIPVERISDIYVMSEMSFNTAFINYISQYGIPMHFFNYYKLYMSFSLSFHIFSNVRIAPFYQLFGHFAFVVNLTYQGLTSYIFPIKRG